MTILDHSPSLELLVSDGVAAAPWVSTARKARAGLCVPAPWCWRQGHGVPLGYRGWPQQYRRRLSARRRGWRGFLRHGIQFTMGHRAGGSACSKTGMVNSSTMTDANAKLSRAAKAAPSRKYRAATSTCAWTNSAKGAREDSCQHAHAFQYFDRYSGQNPFTDSYECEHVLEGTIRASGGIAVGSGSRTHGAGLYAAGDTTSREKLVGAAQSGGRPGYGLGDFVRLLGGTCGGRLRQSLWQLAGDPQGQGCRWRRHPSGREIAIRSARARHRTRCAARNAAVATNYRRSEESMTRSLNALNGYWKDLRASLGVDESLKGADLARAG